MVVLPRAYLDIQLRLAQAVAANGDGDLARSVWGCTNLVRRFGLGPPQVAPSNERWCRFVDGLLAAHGHEDRLDWAEAFARTCASNLGRAGSGPACGPFSVSVVGVEARTHFVPLDRDRAGSRRRGPLQRSQRGRRRAELHRLYRRVRAEHPEVRVVRGVSWLYGIEAYRSLFPPEHVAGAVVRTGTTRFQGSSSWGQFLDHRGGVKEELRLAFLDRLRCFDPEAPWATFPLPTLEVSSPVEVLDRHWTRSG